MASGPRTLRGWKEIATYVGRDVRTVQRWEARRGFPVRRLPGGERGNVYALTSEVDDWLHPPNGGQSPLASEPEPVEPNSPDTESAEDQAADMAEPAASAVGDPAAVPAAGVPPGRRQTWRITAGALVAAGAVLAALFWFHQGRAEGKTASGPVEAPRHYTSPVTGLDALYLQGMYLFGKRTSSSLLEAQRVLVEVTSRDPQYAEAWSGLAQTLTLMTAYGVGIDTATRSQAQAAAKRALALDPQLAEPHAVLGFADFFWNGNVPAAEPEFRNAVRVNPGSALARNWYGTMLTYEGRFTEALQQLEEAQRLEPSSTAIFANRSLALGLSGHRDEAVRMLEQAGEQEPIASVRYNLSVLSVVQPRDLELYLRERLQLSELSHAEDAVRSYAADQAAYRRGGEAAMWREVLQSEANPETLAEAHAALGENEAALALLEQEADAGHGMVDLGMNPLLLPLHHDARFARILSREGLPPVP